MSTVRDYMTPFPYTIGAKQPMVTAHKLMREHRLRHLPVLEGGALVGIVTERDLHLIETLDGTDPRTVTVEEAMTPDPWTVTPETPIAAVAGQMADHRYGAAIVLDRGQIAGIFTTVDALRALVELVSAR